MQTEIQQNVVEKTLDDLRRSGALSGVDVANFVEVSKATVSRWSSGKVTPRTDTQLILSDLRYVVEKLSEFYTPQEVRTWIYSRNDLLEGRRAMELIQENRTEVVLDAIDQLSSLNYA